jgi:hypothetical protein
MTPSQLTATRVRLALVMLVATAGLTGAFAVPQQSTSTASRGVVPRTPWGDPDLQGTWTSDGDAGVPFERPSGFGEK